MSWAKLVVIMIKAVHPSHPGLLLGAEERKGQSGQSLENNGNLTFFFFFFILRVITLKHCSGFCHTLTWISHGFTCIPHPDPPSHLPLHRIPLGLPRAPGPSTCLMHPAWAGDLGNLTLMYPLLYGFLKSLLGNLGLRSFQTQASKS